MKNVDMDNQAKNENRHICGHRYRLIVYRPLVRKPAMDKGSRERAAICGRPDYQGKGSGMERAGSAVGKIENLSRKPIANAEPRNGGNRIGAGGFER